MPSLKFYISELNQMKKRLLQGLSEQKECCCHNDNDLEEAEYDGRDVKL
jgi:hypothetical protein